MTRLEWLLIGAILGLGLLSACGSVEPEPIRSAKRAMTAITYGFPFDTFFEIHVSDLADVQSQCLEPDAMPYHYGFLYDLNLTYAENITLFATRCTRLITERTLQEANLDPHYSLFITDGDDLHLCTEAFLGMAENYYSGLPPRTLTGAYVDPFYLALNWCVNFTPKEQSK